MPAALSTPFAGTPLGRCNPAAKLAAAAIVIVGLLVTADVLTASVVLAAELVALPLLGIGLRALAVRAWPLLVAAGGVAVANIMASSARPATVAAISLRLIAIALPGLVVFAATEPVDLADALVQQVRIPPRFAYGALAGLRLLPLLSLDWESIRRARRARGIDPGRSPLAAAGLAASVVYALVVAAIRRATRLATAMDSRGFDLGLPRTTARRQQVSGRDWALLAATAIVVGGANALAVVAGTWHPLLG